MKQLLSLVISLCLMTSALAQPVGSGNVYVNGQTTAGNMSTNDYSKGTGSNNVNTVDHALYANIAGSVVGGLSTNDGYFVNSVNIGAANTLSGNRLFVIGDHNLVQGLSAAAIGSYSLTTNDFALSVGYSSIAGGYASFAAGESVQAQGYNAIALGNNARALHANSYVWSDGTLAQSTDVNQYTVYAANGMRLLGGPLYGSSAYFGTGLVNETSIAAWNIGGSLLTSSNTFTGLNEFNTRPTTGGEQLGLAGEQPIYGGVFDRPTITYLGSGKINVSQCVTHLYHYDDFSDRLYITTIPAVTNVSLVASDAFTFVYADYNFGTPKYTFTASELGLSGTRMLVGHIYWLSSDDSGHVQYEPYTARGSITKINARFNTEGFTRTDGLNLSPGTNLQFSYTGGTVWSGIESVSVPPFDASFGPNTIRSWAHTNGVYVSILTNALRDGYYDNGSNLVAATPGKYVAHWVYTPITADTNNVAVVYLGNAEYDNATLAEQSQPVAVSTLTSLNGLLLGRFITQVGSNLIANTTSAFATRFTGSSVTSHKDLSDIVGGAPFIHLNQTEYDTMVHNGDAFVYFGTGSPADSNAVLTVVGDGGESIYAQVQNLATTALASADIDVLADDGWHYVDVGQCSSTYTDPGWPMLRPFSGYIYSYLGDLCFGTWGTNAPVRFFCTTNDVDPVENNMGYFDATGWYLPSMTLGSLTLTNGANNITFNTTLITGTKTYTFPNTNGTLALYSDITALPTSNWDTAWTWVNANSNDVAYVFGRTSTWDTTVTIVTAMPTSNWNTAWTWISGNTNNVTQSTNKVWNIASNTNTYQIGYNVAISNNSWLASNTNNLVGTTNSVVMMDTVCTNSTNINISALSVTNFVMTNLAWNVQNIIRARLYIADTNYVPFDQTATLTFKNASNQVGGTEIWQSDMGLTATFITNAVTVGSTNLYISDASSYAANCLVYLTGLTNEFARVQSVAAGNNLILKYPTIASHVVSNGCNRVREMGGFILYDSTRAKKIWGTLEFAVPTTVNLKLDVECSK